MDQLCDQREMPAGAGRLQCETSAMHSFSTSAHQQHTEITREPNISDISLISRQAALDPHGSCDLFIALRFDFTDILM